jgi:hypothetical protein
VRFSKRERLTNSTDAKSRAADYIVRAMSMNNSSIKDFPKIPPGWGADPLSKFIQDTTDNTYATFQNLKQWYNRLKDIPATFDIAVQNMDRTPNWFASFFLIRSHAAYLAGVRLALSGQIPEAYMVSRGSLECALYGLYVARNPLIQETWLRRDEDELSRKRVREEFKAGNLFKLLELEDGRLRSIAGDLYERTIDYGGHPNQQALLCCGFSSVRQAFRNGCASCRRTTGGLAELRQGRRVAKMLPVDG